MKPLTCQFVILVSLIAQSIPFPGPGGVAGPAGVVTVVQGTSGVVAISGTVVSSAAISTTTGDLLFVFARQGAASPSDCSTLTGAITDTASDTFTQIAIVSNGNKGDCYGYWYAKNITGNASNVATVTWSQASLFNTIHILEVSSLSHSSPLDATATGSITTGSSTVTSGPFTTSFANEIIIAGMGTRNLANTFTPDTGYTAVASTKDSQGIAEIEYKIVSSIQTGVTASFTTGVTNLLILVGTFNQ